MTTAIADKWPGLFAWVAQHPMGLMFLDPWVQCALLTGSGAVSYDWFFRQMRPNVLQRNT